MSFKHLAFSFITCLSVAGCKGAVATETELPPQPPIWVVSDVDSEITLYPTLHILPKEIEWKSEELTRRLAEADEVWFEIMPGSETDPALQQSMAVLGMAPGSSLSSHLTPTQVEKLKTVLEPMGLPFAAVDSMRPWLVSTFVGVAALMESGFDLESGVELHLNAMTEGKTIRALETAEGQMQMLASIPEDVQLAMLKDALNELDEDVAVLKEIASDWAQGNVEDLETDLLEEMKQETPIAFDIVFTQRNKNWADIIENELKGSGTDFIAVGAGHLVGDDSVQAILRARGYDVKRL